MTAPLLIALAVQGWRIHQLEGAKPAPVIVVERADCSRCDQPESVEQAPAILPAPVVIAHGDEVTQDVAEAHEQAREAGPFFFVLGDRIVLDTDADPEWSRGPARRDELEGALTLRRAADRRHVPEDLWSLAGESVTLYGPRGQRCQATLGALSVTLRFAGELAHLYEDESKLLAADALDEGSRGRVDAQIFERGPWVLEAEIESVEDCAGATWARLSSDVAPRVYALADDETLSASERALVARAWSSVVRLPLYGGLARGYEDAFAGMSAPSWSSYVAERRRLSLWRGPAGAGAYVTALLGDPGELTCGEFDASLAVVLRVEAGEARPVVVEEALAAVPVSIFDRNSDGAVELVVGPHVTIERALIEQSEDGLFEEVADVTVPYSGCPC